MTKAKTSRRTAPRASSRIASRGVPRRAAGRLVTGIAYRAEGVWTDRCRLDIYRTMDDTPAPVVIWIHGGGLREQEKWVPVELQGQGIVVVAVNYRLDPEVRAPVYVEDVAAAVAWVFAHIGRYGGDPDRIFISGHSAGCYLGDLVVMDRHYLAAHGCEANRLAGNISLSAHKINHFTVREAHGHPGYRAEADALAPLYHVRADAPPTLLVTGDRDLELLGRYEENALFWRCMRQAGHPDIELIELPGFDHGGMLGPSFPLLLQFVRRRAACPSPLPLTA